MYCEGCTLSGLSMAGGSGLTRHGGQMYREYLHDLSSKTRAGSCFSQAVEGGSMFYIGIRLGGQMLYGACRQSPESESVTHPEADYNPEVLGTTQAGPMLGLSGPGPCVSCWLRPWFYG